jgi:SEC-C motif-containing protein
MRSRFCAFAVRDSAYLLRTWHPSSRPPALRLDPEQRWIRLEILASAAGGLFDSAGTVEFRAHYRWHGELGVLHEHSKFVRHENLWSYLGPLPDR